MRLFGWIILSTILGFIIPESVLAISPPEIVKVTLSPDHICGIDSSAPTSCDQYNRVTWSQWRRRKVIFNFDLSLIPDYATITSSTLVLVKTTHFGANANSNIKAYKLKRRVLNGLTWINYKASTPWSTAGAENTTFDRESISSNSWLDYWNTTYPKTYRESIPTSDIKTSLADDWIGYSIQTDDNLGATEPQPQYGIGLSSITLELTYSIPTDHKFILLGTGLGFILALALLFGISEHV